MRKSTIPLEERRRAKYAKYARSPKGRARAKRYAAKPHARLRSKKHNSNRVYVGRRYLGLAPTVEEAAALNRHIKDRLDAFITRQQTRTETESVSEGTVSPEAGTGTDRLGGRHTSA